MGKGQPNRLTHISLRNRIFLGSENGKFIDVEKIIDRINLYPITESLYDGSSFTNIGDMGRHQWVSEQT